MATVPENKLQVELRKITKSLKKPSWGILSKVTAILTKVYDRDSIQNDELPAELATQVINHPGKLYGEATFATGKKLYLPFRDSPELIYSLYGDAKMIVGRSIVILYYDRNIQLGEISLLETKTALQDTSSTTTVFDISGIF